jgi:hypothetical protein
MSTRIRRHPYVLVLIGSSLPLALASFLPIWVVWSFNAREGVGRKGSLWNALAQLPNNIEGVRRPDLLSLHESNLVQAAFIVLCGTFIGLLGARWLSRRSVVQ